MRVLAIDPGYERVGIAILEKNNKEKEKLIYSDCFNTSPHIPFCERLTLIGNEVFDVIKKYSPNILAIEQLFFNSNQKTVMRVAEVRGAIIYISTKNDLSVFEYTPLQIKNAITGYGRGTKKQIAHMVRQLIDIDKKVMLDDEYDAIAIGLTCCASESF